MREAFGDVHLRFALGCLLLIVVSCVVAALVPEPVRDGYTEETLVAATEFFCAIGLIGAPFGLAISLLAAWFDARDAQEVSKPSEF